MEYLKGFYDRNGKVFDGDRYSSGRDELHVHFSSGGSFCAVFRAEAVGDGKRHLVNSATNSRPGDIPSSCKRPVFVWI